MAYSQAKLETGATKIDITSEGRGSSFGKVSKGLTTLYLRVLKVGTGTCTRGFRDGAAAEAMVGKWMGLKLLGRSRG